MKLSLRLKAVILIILTMTLLSGTFLAVSSRYMTAAIDEQFRTRANDLARTVASSIEPDSAERVVQETMSVLEKSETLVFSDQWGTEEFNAYLEPYQYIQSTPDFKNILHFLRRIQDVNDVDCIYLVAVSPERKAAVYVVDAAYEDACLPGVLDPIYEFNTAVLENPGIGFPAYFTNTPEYGALVTAGCPVFNDRNDIVGYAMVDISMNEVRASQSAAVRKLLAITLGVTLIVAAISIIAINKAVVDPINQLTDAAERFRKDNELQSHVFENLNIHTGDEIETLAESMALMEESLNRNIANLVQVSDALEKSEKLAVKDALTGIRNKLGYNREAERLENEIASGTAKFGLAMIDLNFLKVMNDEYGHEKGDLALINISKIICDIFLHSPVFRIGGDEFIVILQNNDYDKAPELIKQFEDKIDAIAQDESLPPWERVSASLGCAMYDPAIDTGVDDVFQRADKAMYLRKIEMKTVRT